MLTFLNRFQNLNEFVDAARVFGPGQLEVFPEAGGAQVEHTAPVVADNVQGAGYIARQRLVL